jgi:hypothetical protein
MQVNWRMESSGMEEVRTVGLFSNAREEEIIAEVNLDIVLLDVTMVRDPCRECT